MAKDHAAEEHALDVRIEAANGRQVELPSGDFVANAEFAREGADLYLTSPDGHTVMVEGYFSQNPPPDIVTADGAHLSPEMVDAFMPPQHIGQYAASGQVANDASPAGKITEIAGEAHIVRADGTRVAAEVGTPVYPGDVVETSATGAVNLLFSDNTTFAISESARLSVDQYVYNSQEQSGSTFFSMLQGVFVYTSGLIGKNDPSSVNIETPVGSIGIRGTVVAGDIAPAGQESRITIVDGAIVLSNGAGTMEMNASFQTAALTSYQQAPSSLGVISVASFTQSYSAVAGVANDTFSNLDTFARGGPAPANGNGGDAPAGATAGTEGQPAPVADAPSAPAPDAGATAPMPPPANAAPQTAPMPPPPPAGEQPVMQPPPPSGTMMLDPGMNVMPPPPPPGSTFGGLIGPATAPPPPTMAGTSPTSGFNTAPPPGGTAPMSGSMGTTAMGTVQPPPPPPPAGTTTTAPPPPPGLSFAFSPYYMNGTTPVADDGVSPFLLGAPLETNGMVLVGRVSLTGVTLPADTVLTMTGPAGGGANQFGGSIIEYNSTTTGNLFDTRVATTGDAFIFDPATGNLYAKQPGAFFVDVNPSFNFTVSATSASTGLALTQSFTVIHEQPPIALPGSNVLIGDPNTNAPQDPFSGNVSFTNDTIAGTSGKDFILGREGNDTIIAGGGQDAILGGNGNDKIVVSTTDFRYIDGGAGTDTLVLGDPTRAQINFDLLTMPANLNGVTTPSGNLITGLVRNIEVIELARSSGTNVSSDLRLDIRDVFDMTSADGAGNHTLTVISGQTGTGGSPLSTGVLTIADAAGAGFRDANNNLNVVSGTLGSGNVTIQGVYNGATVTLIIQQTDVTHNTQVSVL